MARMQVIEGCHPWLWVSGSCSLLIAGIGKSGASPAAALIEKETLKKRISNNECRMSKECILSILKRLSEAKPSFEILRFDIRYFAVRF